MFFLIFFFFFFNDTATTEIYTLSLHDALPIFNLSVDYAPGGPLGWGTSLQWTWLSARVETSDDRYRLPPLNTLNVGIRYATRLFSRSCSARLDVGNVTNASGLTFSSTYYALAVPQLRRNYTLTKTSGRL